MVGQGVGVGPGMRCRMGVGEAGLLPHPPSFPPRGGEEERASPTWLSSSWRAIRFQPPRKAPKLKAVTRNLAGPFILAGWRFRRGGLTGFCDLVIVLILAIII